MKISELTKKLQIAQARYGDIEVTVDGEEIRDSAVFSADNTSGFQFLLSASEAE